MPTDGTDRAALVAAVRAAVDETYAEYAQMPFFVRPLVRRGFEKRTGMDAAAWRRLLDGGPTPALTAALQRLAAHYDGAPERARRGMGARPEELREVERRSRARAEAARALAEWDDASRA
jgi:hypothetical protein